MADKLKVLVVGGDDRSITDETRERLDVVHIQSDRTIQSVIAPDAKAIVAISRFMSGVMFDKARDAAQRRGIPFVQAKTGNYVIPVLVKRGLLTPAPTAASVPPKPAPAQTPKPVETSVTGIQVDRLWDIYGAAAGDAIRDGLDAGEVVTLEELIELLMLIGLPPSDCENHLIPELAVRGFIERVSDTEWKRPGVTIHRRGTRAHLKPAWDAVSAKSAKENERLAKLMAGLPEGPYRSVNQLQDVTGRFAELLNRNGKPLTWARMGRILDRAQKLGIVAKNGDGQYHVKHDASVKLTQIKPLKQDSKPVVVEVTKPDEKSTPNEIHETLVKFYRGKLRESGMGVPSVEWIKGLVPTEYWNECAARSCAKLSSSTSFKQHLDLRERMPEDLWDLLAWYTLRGLPIDSLLPFAEAIDGRR